MPDWPDCHANLPPDHILGTRGRAEAGLGERRAGKGTREPLLGGQGKAVTRIWKRALLGLTGLALIMAVLLFLPAWSLAWWEAWLYWVVFLGASLFVTLHFLRRDPELIERRLTAGPGAEQERSQQVIQSALSLVFAALLLVPGFDHRLHWSAVPLPMALVADAFVAAGFWLIFRVFSENSYASNTVRVEAGQEVISTGPYRFVRHPMYSGGLVLFVFTPLALGSWWAFAPGVLLCCGAVARLLEEERFLTAHLVGYAEYREKVQRRLIPFVW